MKRRLAAAVLAVSAVMAGCAGPPEDRSPSVPPASPASPSSTQTAATTSPSPSPSPGQPVGSWDEATVPEAAQGSATVSVVRGGDGLVAIGFDGAFGSILWTSGDGGRSWTDITPDEFASVGIANVVEFDGMLVAVGRGNTTDVEAQEAAVYLSSDGVSWRKVASPEPMVGQLIDVVATDDGLFAVGGVPGADAAGIWRSEDGEAWERIGGDFPAAFMWSIAEGGPGLVVVGWRRNPEPDLAVWTSSDAGVTWELAPDPEGFAGFEGTDVAALPDGSLAMVGSALDGSGGRIWHSADGLAWTLAVDDMAGTHARSLAVTPAGFVAVGGGEDMNGRAWSSADGADWTPLAEPVEGAYFTNVVLTDERLLVTGGSQSGTIETGIQAFARIWSGE